MKLADKYSISRIEDACSRALSYTPSPSLRSVQSILKTGAEKLKNEINDPSHTPSGKFGFTRGAEYFGGGDND